MAQTFGGTEAFTSEPSLVYAALTNLDAVQQNIPDLVSAEKLSDTSLKCVVKPGFSFLRSQMTIIMTLSDLVPNEKASMKIDAKAIGVELEATSHLQLSKKDDGGTLLQWDAQVGRMKGLVATLSPSLVEAAAKQVIQQTWSKLHAQVA